MKTSKSLTAVILILAVLISSAYGQQWEGARNTTGKIYRSGSIGIGMNNPQAKLDVFGDGSHWSQGFLFLRNKNNKDAGIMLYNDIDVKYRIFNEVRLDNLFRIIPEGNVNGGISIKQNGKVGIGTKDPKEMLTVNGRISADNYFYERPKSGQTGVAGAVFIPYTTSDIAWVPNENGYGYLISDPLMPAGTGDIQLCNGNCYSIVSPTTGTIVLRTDIILPEKAIITKFTCFWLDKANNARADFEFKLMKKQFFENEAWVMATVKGSTPGSRDSVQSTSVSIINLFVDKYNSTYYIFGTWKANELGDDLRFYGCQVDYTIKHAGQQ